MKDAPVTPTGRPRVALFVTCLADLFRPSVAFDSLALLRRAGCAVYVPRQQTCCGQPAYNTGDYEATAPLARQVVAMLERTRRQHRMVRTRRIDQGVAWFNERPP